MRPGRARNIHPGRLKQNQPRGCGGRAWAEVNTGWRIGSALARKGRWIKPVCVTIKRSGLGEPTPAAGLVWATWHGIAGTANQGSPAELNRSWRPVFVLARVPCSGCARAMPSLHAHCLLSAQGAVNLRACPWVPYAWASCICGARSPPLRHPAPSVLSHVPFCLCSCAPWGCKSAAILI